MSQMSLECDATLGSATHCVPSPARRGQIAEGSRETEGAAGDGCGIDGKRGAGVSRRSRATGRLTAAVRQPGPDIPSVLSVSVAREFLTLSAAGYRRACPAGMVLARQGITGASGEGAAEGLFGAPWCRGQGGEAGRSLAGRRAQA